MRVLLEGAVCQGCGQEVAYTIVRGQVIKRGWLHPDGNLRCTDASRTNHRYQEPDQ